MADLNEVRLIGRLTKDPELRAIPSGMSICTFGLATSRKYQANGDWKEETTFVDITAWSKTAEAINKYCKKGKLIFVGGRLKLDSWQDKQSGEKKQKLSVVADNVQFLDKAEAEQSQQWQPPNQEIRNYAPVASTKQTKQAQEWNPTWSEPNLGEPPF